MNISSFKSAWIFACAFQLSSKTFPCIFLAGLHFVSEKNDDKISKRAQWMQQSGTRAFQPKKDTGWECFFNYIEKHVQKFRYFWRTKKFHPKRSLRSVLHQVIHLFWPWKVPSGEWLAGIVFFFYPIVDLCSLTVCLYNLYSWQNAQTQHLSRFTVRGKVLSRTLGTLHNLSKRVPTRRNFADCQAVNVLVPLLKAEVALFSAKSLLILAYLIDEGNNHLIMADEGKPYYNYTYLYNA